MIRKAIAATVATLLGAMPLGVSAGWMDEFYTQAGAGVNVTAPQAVQTQNSLGFTGGGVAWRYPNTTLNPIQITPPSLKMGCGGIDAYLGGYSFVNKDAFVQALRNFGQAAVGYFFQLALRSMAPEVAVTLDAINDIAQKINQFGANSCQMGALAAQSFADKVGVKNREAASGYVTAVGEAVDWFDAKTSLQDGGGTMTHQKSYQQRYNKLPADVTTEDYCKSTPVDANAVYWALCNARVNVTDDEKRLIMSLLGAEFIVVGVPDADGETQPKEEGRGPTISISDLIGRPGDIIANLNVLTCQNAECTKLSTEVVTQVPYVTLVEGLMTHITNAVLARTPVVLDATDEAILKLSSVPLWRVAALSTAGGQTGILAAAMRTDLAEYAATDAAVNMVHHYMDIMEKALLTSGAKLPGPLQERKGDLQQRVRDVRARAMTVAAEMFRKRGDPWQKIDQLDKIERAMMGSLNQHIAANQRFLNRH